ncbi:MAG: AAA family ATPase [Phycisphaerae bacterium]
MSVQVPEKPKFGTPSIGIPTVSDQVDRPFEPAAPRDFAEAGLDPNIAESLILKYLVGTGSASGATIATELCMPAKATMDHLAVLKQQQIVVHTGTASMGDFRYALTDAGRDRAARHMLESMYVGPAPVPIDTYIESIAAQTIAHKSPREAALRRAFSDLLISDQMFAMLGPAISSGRGMFLYGRPGNGKTSVAERVTACFGDEIWIPRCVLCGGLIIKLFDPANHEVVETKTSSILHADQTDPRWVRIKRPTIVVGGELTMDALDVQYNATTKTCEAPIQMKSNCGTLVIDDFGRQRMRPIELLNRWIVPLEKRYDFLALPNGRKFRIPFDQLIIFSTNLEPKELCDDAFLRRIPYKIHFGDPTEAEFRKLFDFVAPQVGFTLDDDAWSAIDYLIETHYRKAKRSFRCCQPRDLLLQVRNRCVYQNQPLRLTPELLDYAVSVYFTIM